MQKVWDLNAGFRIGGKQDIDGALDKADSIAAEIEALRPHLDALTSEQFKFALSKIEEFAFAVRRISGYASLLFAQDTQDKSALALLGRIEQRVTEAQNRMLFFDLWWRSLNDDQAEQYAKDSGALRYYLIKQRLYKPHTLSEPEEKVISLKDINGVNALTKIYDVITNKFVFELEIEGQKKRLSRDALMVYAKSESPDMREAAYREQYRVFTNESTVLSQIYMHRVRDWSTECLGMRGFETPISARNLSNDMENNVVDTLLEVCTKNSHVFQEYFRLKARASGMTGLRRFDLYAPLGIKPRTDIPYADAVRQVLESFSRFSADFHGMAKTMFDRGRVDHHIRDGKRSGAFCMGILPDDLPWVLLNYTGELRQVSTLAHELGHAVHFITAGGQSVLSFDAPLPLAETASVFSEMLFMERVLEGEKDQRARAALIADSLDDMYATVMRQAYFTVFERDAHKAVSEGASEDDLDSIYWGNLKAQFGDSVDIDGMFRKEWITIPHMYHTPFYCYSYSFGFLLSLSLFGMKYKNAGLEGTVKKILSYGGAEKPSFILSEAGIDIHSAGFWDNGFRVIDGLVGQLSRSLDAIS